MSNVARAVAAYGNRTVDSILLLDMITPSFHTQDRV